MKVLSLFDGIASGLHVLKKLGIQVDTYYASEIDEKAVKVAMHNHPEIVQVGDITKLNGDDFSDVDLILAGSPCFVKGTKVITKNRYKNIEDVVVGDEVLTHKNRFRKVIRVGGDPNKELFEIRAQGMKPTKVTGNHPYYVRQMNRKMVDGKNTRLFSDPIWKNAKDLDKGDFIGLPIMNTSENPRNLSEEDCWLIGRYIADGHYTNHPRRGRKDSKQYNVIYSIGSAKLGEFTDNVNRHFTSHPHSKSVHRCIISSKEFVNMLIDMEVGKGAANKRIPMEILHLPKPLLEKVIDGYISGDGSYRKSTDSYRANSVSEELILTLSLAIAKVYHTNSGYEYTKTPDTCVIEGRTVNQKDYYVTSYRKEMRKQSNAKVIDDMIWLPIKNVTNLEIQDDVFNIEVDEDNSYTANNIVVHNCQGFSMAGKQLAFDDPRSKLFFEFTRLLKEINPKYFFLENNRMKQEFLDVIDNEVGLTSVKINSADISHQNRVRHYWTNIPDVPTITKNTELNLSQIIGEYEGIWVYPRGYNSGGVKGYKGKCPCITTSSWEHNFLKVIDGEKVKFTPEEIEQVQGLPIGYTSILSPAQRYKKIGNGWSIPVIEHFFNALRNDLEN
jgi:site-specific DNA-cytosine methylase